MSMFRLRMSPPHGVSLLIWLVVGFSSCAWILSAQGVPVADFGITPTPVQRRDPDSAWVTKALEAIPVNADTAAAGGAVLDTGRFVLAGVIAQGGGRGAALIAVDGKPAKPFAVSALVAPGWVLARLERQSVWLAPEDTSGNEVQLSLVPPDTKRPPIATAATQPALGMAEAAKPTSPQTPLNTAPNPSSVLPKAAEATVVNAKKDN